METIANMGPYLLSLTVAILGFAVLWPASVVRRDASVVDFWWAPAFAAQAIVFRLAGDGGGAHADLALLLVVLWAVRLGWVLSARRLSEGHEDPRYTSIRRSWGAAFWWKSFFIVFLLQAFVQWTVGVGMAGIQLSSTSGIGLVAFAGALIALCGLGVEAVADRELDRFKQDATSGELLTSGLRAHVRHPNYLGEIVFWSGVAIIGVDAGVWQAVFTPVLIAVLLTRVSGIPMLDEHLSESRPAYAKYRDEVPALIPRWRRLLRVVQ